MLDEIKTSADAATGAARLDFAYSHQKNKKDSPTRFANRHLGRFSLTLNFQDGILSVAENASEVRELPLDRATIEVDADLNKELLESRVFELSVQLRILIPLSGWYPVGSEAVFLVDGERRVIPVPQLDPWTEIDKIFPLRFEGVGAETKEVEFLGFHLSYAQHPAYRTDGYVSNLGHRYFVPSKKRLRATLPAHN